MNWRRRAWLWLLVAVPLSASACLPRPAEEAGSVEIDGDRVPVRRFQDAVLGLCTARAQAVSDPGSARITFEDESHDALHLIAAAVNEVDRPAAGSLLAAKNRVEDDLARGATSDQLASDLDALLEETRSALEKISVASPDCPPA